MFLTSSSLVPLCRQSNLHLQSSKLDNFARTSLRIYLFISCLILLNIVNYDRSYGDEFVRGDVNSDFIINLTDPLNTLGYLFLGNVSLSCEDALDSDDDGQHSINDAIYTLSYLFLGTSQPPKPFPQAGSDPSEDPLSCGEKDTIDYELPDHIPSMEKLLNPSQAITQSEFSSAVKVPLDLHEAIQSLEEGQAIASLWENAPQHWEEGLSVLAPKDKSKPIVQITNATFNLPTTGCVKISAQQIARYSFLPDSEENIFIRGDVSADGKVDEIDLEMMENSLLNHEFHYREQLCDDAWDVNDDGEVNSNDYDQLYDYLFERSFIPIPNETTGCGVDPSPDNLGDCESGYCRAGHDKLQFKVEPEEICEPGWHRVKVSVSRLTTSETGERVADPDSTVVRDTLVNVCSPEAECSVEKDHLVTPILSRIRCKTVITFIITPFPEVEKHHHLSFNDEGEQSERSTLKVPPTQGAISSEVVFNGIGPSHQLVTRRIDTNCVTPRTQGQAQGAGSFEVAISTVCKDENGLIVKGVVKPEVTTGGHYSSTLFVNTNAEGDEDCSSFVPKVEAQSQDSATFMVDEKFGFLVSGNLQSGNEITLTQNFNLGNGITFNSKGEVSSEVKVTGGVSQTVIDNTGRLSKFISAEKTVTKAVEGMTTIQLYAEGESRFIGDRQSHGLSFVSREASGLWGVYRHGVTWMPDIWFFIYNPYTPKGKSEMDKKFINFLKHHRF